MNNTQFFNVVAPITYQVDFNKKHGYIESAEQSITAEQNKISKLTVKLQIILTEHVAKCNSYWQNITYTGRI